MIVLDSPRRAAAPRVAPFDADYARKLTREGQRQRDKSAAQREIATSCPPVKDLVRKAAALKSLRKFLKSYFPGRFSLEWSQDHLDVIAETERIIRQGGQLAVAMPRASGKTAILECAVIWAILTGLHQFVVLIGSNRDAARELLRSILNELQTNDLLYEDFPEVCHAVRAVSAANQRRPLWNGATIRQRYTEDEMILPNLPANPAAGAVIRVFGLLGRIRGTTYSRPGGVKVRPSLVLLDDPQTDRSAHSAKQNERRERTLAGAVLGLAGPGKKIAALMACTVIARDDMADRTLNRELHPEWNGRRTKLLYEEPDNKELWAAYNELRMQGLRAGVGLKLATPFYRKHRRAMDAGAKAAWPARFNPDEISAVQYAMNLKFQDPAAFASEFQNEPLTAETIAEQTKPDQVVRRVNAHARGLVPLRCEHVAAGIDVQGQLLYWVIVAAEPDTTAHVIDYGCWPRQASTYFALRDASPRLKDIFPQRDDDAQLYAGLAACLQEIGDRDIRRDDGQPMRVGRIVVDARWKANVVYEACRQSRHVASCIPAEGIIPKGPPLGERKPKPGEVIRDDFILGTVGPERPIRKATFDSNAWISKVHAGLNTPVGVSGSLQLFEAEPHLHRMYADHITAETFDDQIRFTRPVRVWTLKPGADNHWLDATKLALLGCYVLGARPGWSKPVLPRVAQIPAHMRPRHG